MHAQQNIAQNQQKFVIRVDDKVAKIVSPTDRQEIASAYLQMFSGFAWVNWTNKYSLGRAWQTALGQCGSFIENKGNKNPAAKYLANAYVGHKKYWSRVIMMHSARENTINPDDQKIKQLREHGTNMIRGAMDKINLVLARYNERVEELITTQTKQAQLHTSARAPQVAAATVQPAQTATVATPAATPAPVVKNVNPTAKPVVVQSSMPRQQAKQVVTPTPKPQAAPKPDNRAAFNIAKQRLEQQSAQAKMAMQQKLKIWIIGQNYQNAA